MSGKERDQGHDLQKGKRADDKAHHYLGTDMHVHGAHVHFGLPQLVGFRGVCIDVVWPSRLTLVQSWTLKEL